MDIYEGFTETEIAVVEQLANKGGRSYETIASAVGISERQLYRYRQKPYIRNAIKQRTLQEVEEDVPEILGALRKNARKGDFRSIELIVKMLGLLTEKSVVEQRTTIQDNRYQDMTADEIEQEIQSIDQELRLIEGGGGDSK